MSSIKPSEIEDKVKVPSKRKYPCKRNKGEHEWGDPKLKYPPQVTYIYKLQHSTLHTHTPYKEHKLRDCTVDVWLEITCIHCGKKHLSYLSDKIK